jgi:hypothetical protein
LSSLAQQICHGSLGRFVGALRTFCCPRSEDINTLMLVAFSQTNLAVSHISARFSDLCAIFPSKPAYLARPSCPIFLDAFLYHSHCFSFADIHLVLPIRSATTRLRVSRTQRQHHRLWLDQGQSQSSRLLDNARNARGPSGSCSCGISFSLEGCGAAVLHCRSQGRRQHPWRASSQG